MKKLIVILSACLFATVASNAISADKPFSDAKFSGVNIKMSFHLQDGNKLLTSGEAISEIGQPSPLSVITEVQYIAKAQKVGGKVVLTPGVVKTGFSTTLTPTLLPDGKISVVVSANRTELISLKTVKLDEFEVQRPEVSTIKIDQKFSLDSGKEIAIPFGQYTLKIIATKS